jgi:hypothetical protein
VGDPDGTSLGSWVGFCDGDNDGTPDGACDGVLEGDTVGTEIVGPTEGAREGCRLGPKLGTQEGRSDGFAEGLVVVGRVDGSLVDGDLDGFMLGLADVGCRDGESDVLGAVDGSRVGLAVEIQTKSASLRCLQYLPSIGNGSVPNRLEHSPSSHLHRFPNSIHFHLHAKLHVPAQAQPPD